MAGKRHIKLTERERKYTGFEVGLPYVRIFPDMSGNLAFKSASGRNSKMCLKVRDLLKMHFMKYSSNNFTTKICGEDLFFFREQIDN